VEILVREREAQPGRPGRMLSGGKRRK